MVRIRCNAKVDIGALETIIPAGSCTVEGRAVPGPATGGAETGNPYRVIAVLAGPSPPVFAPFRRRQRRASTSHFSRPRAQTRRLLNSPRQPLRSLYRDHSQMDGAVGAPLAAQP
jgi:hypothetical protein